jgi:undecaprenyl-diphosphatase
MSVWEAIILGIVQGITEFLPISSSGHLVLLQNVFGIQTNFVFFSVMLHVATLFAVLLHFRKQVWQIVKKPFGSYAIKLYIATVPAIIVALLFSNQLKLMFTGSLLPFCFVFTGALLIVCQIFSKSVKEKKLDFKGSFIMGLMQGIAVVPGISRSGSTIAGGLIAGYEKEEVANFSFLMSIPIILASLAFELFTLIKAQSISILPLQTIIASIFAFVVGLLSISLMLKAVKKLKLHYFSFYLFALAIIAFFFVR